MPAQQAAVAGGGQGQQQPQQKSNAIFGILRMIAMWYMFKTFFGGGGQQKKLSREEIFAPHFPKGTSLDMSVYLSESPYFRDFSGSRPVWQEADVQLGLAAERKLNVTYRPSQVRLFACATHLQPMSIPSTPVTAISAEGSGTISSLQSMQRASQIYTMTVNLVFCRAGCPEQWLCIPACLLCAKRPRAGSKRSLLPEQHRVQQEPW